MTQNARVVAGLLALGLMITPLTACAPEPGADLPPGVGGKPPAEKVEPEGGSWPEENPDEIFEKHVELPTDFPAEFVVPEGAVVDNAGSRGSGTWFVVFTTPDAESAQALWNDVIAAGGFTVSDEAETPEGGVAATLSSPSLEVVGMTLPGDDAVQVSYDLTTAL